MKWHQRYRTELILFAFSLAAYALSSWEMLARQSLAPHFVWQADAFLHGQLAVAPPPNTNDWVYEGGRWYVSFPPFPAVLMMPLVLLFGRAFNDTAFTIVFAALNVALLYRFLRTLAEREEGPAAGVSAEPRAPADDLWLALLFGFGSVAWSCGIRGEVWFTAETVGVTLTLCYLLAATRARHPALAGLALACATITRTPLAFSIVFFLLEALLAPADSVIERMNPKEKVNEKGNKKVKQSAAASAKGGDTDSPAASGALPMPRATLAAIRGALGDGAQRGLAMRRLAKFALPLIAVGIPMAAMNLARFGSAGEFGHSHLYNNRVNADIARWGLFNYAYLERNLHAAFTRLPALQMSPLRLGFDPHGMSLLVTTPLFLWLLWPRSTPRITRALWLTVAAISLPGFFYQNDGFAQFGFRFALDYTPYLFALLALGGRPLDGLFWLAGFAGVAVNLWGAIAFNRMI